MHAIWNTLCFLFVLAILTPANSSEPSPTLVSEKEAHARRSKIQRELDGNHDAVQELYEILDVTPDRDHKTREYLEDQIHQFDARSDILYQELDAIDRHEFQHKRKAELETQAAKLLEEAKQLRRGKHFPAALAREAKAADIKKSIADGSWKRVAKDEWSCEAPKADLAEKVKMAIEIERLKEEAATMKAELAALRLQLFRLTQGGEGARSASSEQKSAPTK